MNLVTYLHLNLEQHQWLLTLLGLYPFDLELTSPSPKIKKKKDFFSKKNKSFFIHFESVWQQPVISQEQEEKVHVRWYLIITFVCNNDVVKSKWTAIHIHLINMLYTW